MLLLGLEGDSQMRSVIGMVVVMIVIGVCQSPVGAGVEHCYWAMGHYVPEWSNIYFYCEPVGTEDMDGGEFEAVSDALATMTSELDRVGWWANLIYGNIDFHNTPPFPGDEDGENWIFWVNDAELWLSRYSWDQRAVIRLHAHGEEITQADIACNDWMVDYYWGDGSAVTMDVKSYLMHELGHFVGLADLNEPEYNEDVCGMQVMWYETYPNTVYKRQLQEGDRSGMWEIYQHPLELSYFEATPESAQVLLEWFETDCCFKC